MSEQPAATAAVRACTWTVQDTPIGPLLLAATDEGLVNVVFHAGPRTADLALARLAGRLGAPPVRADSGTGGAAGPANGPAAQGRAAGPGAAPIAHPALRTAAAELVAYFRGELRTFTVELDWSLTAGFAARVLRALHTTVPFGTTVGYQHLADRVGEPGAARAVGMAMGANPLPVVVPCHRVLESGGGLGGFGGGRETKRALLALEGLLPQPLF